MKKKNIKKLILLGCNTAHDSYPYNNIAYEFRKRVNGPVIGADGTVRPGVGGYKPIQVYNSDADQDWRDLCIASGRGERKMNWGWMMYPGTARSYRSNQLRLNIEQLCTLHEKNNLLL